MIPVCGVGLYIVFLSLHTPRKPKGRGKETKRRRP
jgi:hypothetical protein